MPTRTVPRTFKVSNNLNLKKTPYDRVTRPTLAPAPPTTSPYVQATIHIITDNWPNYVEQKQDLQTFVNEVLRRCQFSRQLLETALYYLVKLKPHVEDSSDPILECPRKVVLGCLILAGKYMQDRPFSMGAWSKICGLAPSCLVKIELVLLDSLNWDMFIPHHGFDSLRLHLLSFIQPTTKPKALIPISLPELTDDDSS